LLLPLDMEAVFKADYIYEELAQQHFQAPINLPAWEVNFEFIWCQKGQKKLQKWKS